MAGRPLRRAMIQELERRAEDAELPDVLTYVSQWLAGGQTIQELAQDMSCPDGPSFSRTLLGTYVNTLPDAAQRLTEARAQAAHAHTDKALELADNVKPQPDEIAKVNTQIRLRQWLAEKQNREAYGQTSKVEVTHTLNTLHLDALRARHIPNVPTLPPGTPEVHTLEPGDDAA